MPTEEEWIALTQRLLEAKRRKLEYKERIDRALDNTKNNRHWLTGLDKERDRREEQKRLWLEAQRRDADS